ncbi:MAG: DVUA0089 family protein [Planctomycetota bacterium]|nr:DVUA0089 family protein [Planctomycetota bacterium]
MQPETDLPSACPALEPLEPRLLLAQNLMVIVPAEFVPGDPLPVVLACNEISPGPFMNYAIVAIGPEGNRKIVDLFDSSGTDRLSETADRSIEFDDYDPDTQTQYEYLQVCMTANWWYTVGYIRPSDYNDPACFDGSTLPIRVGFDYKNAVGVPYFQLVDAATEFIPALPTWSGGGWGWYAGDTHFHTDFTDNGAEFGDPLLVDSLIGGEKNLGWFAYTDHSYELDNELSINPELPPFGDPDVLMSLIDYRDAPETNAWGDSPGDPYSHGAAWCALPIKGEEMSVDGWHVPGEAVFRQHHLLVYGFGPEDTVIRSTESDNFDDDNGPTDLRDMNTILDELAARSGPDYPTFGYAAHPATAPEWTQIIDYTWSQPWTADIATDAYNYGLANGQHLLRGFEFWNSENDKVSESGALHSGRDASLEMWEDVLANLMDPADGTGVPHHWYLVGGSDSHGARRIGEVRTVLCAPDDGAGDILDALYYGRGIVTDGPYFAMGLDLNGDGDIMDFGVDTMMGEQAVLAGPNQADLHFDWPNQSATAWGDVPMEDILLYHYDSNGAADPNGPYDYTSGYHDLAQNTFDLYQLWLDQGSPAGWQCFRAELFMNDLTDPGRSYKAYTNPIWVYFLPPPEVSVAATDPSASEIGPDPGTFTISRTGPTNTALEVQFTIAGSTADSGVDCADLGDYVIIPIGASSVTLTVAPVIDYENEPTERINLTLTPLTLYTFGPGRSDYVSITNAVPPGIQGSHFAVQQGHPLAPTGHATVDLSVQNLGDMPAGPFDIEVYLSDDPDISAADMDRNEYWLGMMIVPEAGTFDLDAGDNANRGQDLDKDHVSAEKHLPMLFDGTTVTAEPIAVGQTIQAAIGDEWIDDRDMDTYEFQAAAGQRLGFDIDNGPGGENFYRSYIRVFDSNWNLLAENRDGRAPDDLVAPYNSYLQYTFAAAGTYYLVVSADNETSDPRRLDGRDDNITCPYAVALTDIIQPDLFGTYLKATPDHPLPADGHTTVTFSVRNDGTADAGTFTVEFWLLGRPGNLSIDPGLRVGDMVGTVTIHGLAKGVTHTSQATLDLSAFGIWCNDNQYWVDMLVDSANVVAEYDEANNANLGHEKDKDDISAEYHLPSPEDHVNVVATPMAAGAPIAASIGGDEWIGPEDMDTYVFTAAAGQTIGLDVDVTSGNLDSYLWLYDSAWNLLAENNDEAAPGDIVADSYLEHTFAAAGQYYAAVAPWNHNPTTTPDPRETDQRIGMQSGGMGNYTLTLTALAGPSSLGPKVSSVRPLYQCYLEVVFNEPVTRWTFTADDITVTGPSGNVTATMIVLSPEFQANPATLSARTWWVMFGVPQPGGGLDFPPLPQGTYSFTIGPNVEDTAGNLMDQDGDRTYGEAVHDRYSGSFVIDAAVTYAELSITSVAGPAQIAVDGTGTVKVTVRNSGGAASAACNLDVYLSQDDQFGRDLALAAVRVPAIAAGRTWTCSVPVNLAAAAGVTAGPCYWVAGVDTADEVDEENEFDNSTVGNAVQVTEPLVPNLVGQIGRVTLPAFVVPGDKGRASIVVTNSGTGPVAGQMNIDLYASADQNYDAGDTPLASLTGQTVRLAPGRSTTYTAGVVVPPSMPDSFYILAKIDSTDAIAETSETDNLAYSDTPRLFAWRFGSFAGRTNVKLIVADVLHNLVTFALSGGGYGEVEGGADFTRVVFTGTGASSAAGTLYAAGSLRSIGAAAVNLSGGADIAGSLGTLKLGDVTGAAIEIGGAPASTAGVAITLDHATDVSVTSGMPITSVTANQWLETDGTVETIEAPRVGTLAVSDDFEANLRLTGAGVSATGKTLGSATIKGSVAPSVWDVQGKVGAVTIKGAAGAGGSPWQLVNASSLASLTLGDVANGPRRSAR